MYQFPFTDDIVRDQWGARKLTFSRHVLSTSLFEQVGSVVLEKNGRVMGCTTGTWKTERGQIVIYDGRGKPSVCFDGIETKNGGVYLDGEMLEYASEKGFVRAVMHPYDYLGEHNYELVVSSHVNYYDVAVPRLLRTLLRAGLADRKISIVACGARVDEEFEVLGFPNATCYNVTWHAMGFAGLAAADKASTPYVMLLHDTCDVTDDFPEKMSGLDVGGCNDIQLMNEGFEVGLYATDFARRCGQIVAGTTNTKLYDTITGMAERWAVIGVPPRDAGMKDVYGQGNQRRVFYYDALGIRKYRTDTASGGRP